MIICYRKRTKLDECKTIIKKILDSITDEQNIDGLFSVTYKFKYACYNYDKKEFYKNNTTFYVSDDYDCKFMRVKSW